MDSGTEVLRAVAAIAIAFETAADSLESIRDHKERKKRKREKDIEELFEIKILHKSLLHGGHECRKHCESRRRQFGPPFEVGDAVALPALSNVVIALQTEIHQTLHHVRNMENATLDLTALHESSITSRKDATRAMDQLCQRIMASIRVQSPQVDDKTIETWSPSESSMRSASASVQPPSLNESCEIPPAFPLQTEKKLPSLPAAFGHAGRVIYQPIQRVLPQRTVSIRRTSDAASQNKRSVIAHSFEAPTSLLFRGLRPSLSETKSTASAFGQNADDQSQPGHFFESSSGTDHYPMQPSRTSPIEHSIVSRESESISIHPERASSSSIQPSVFLVRDGNDTDIKTSSPTSVTSLYRYQDVGSIMINNEPPVSADPEQSQQRPEFQRQERRFSTISNQVPSIIEPQDSPVSTGVGLSVRVVTPLSSTRPAFQHSYATTELIMRNAHDLGPSPARDEMEAHVSAPLYFTIEAGDYIPVQDGHNLSSPKLDPEPGPVPEHEQSIPREQTSDMKQEGTSTAQTHPARPALTIDGGIEMNAVAPSATSVSEPEARRADDSQCENGPNDVGLKPDANEAMVGNAERNTSRLAWDASQEKDFSKVVHALRTPESIENITAAQFKEKLRPVADLANEKFSASLTQADYQERLSALSKGQDNVWLPLQRPALHNRYHGFCKGAWQIRKAADEGLQVYLTPSIKEPVIHWQCMACNFTSKAPNADALPSHILFNQKYNVRYRWLFLAKSHRSASAPFETAESYEYGCIFCAAQGHVTAKHERLEHLFVHIMSKHKSAMLTPEIKGKTKTIIGSVVDKAQDWDIILPESGAKGVGTTADELRISAGKLWGRRKGKK